ncbi:WD40 repeat-like protein, partial [Coniophora puteana RWD-64-598 SS2]
MSAPDTSSDLDSSSSAPKPFQGHEGRVHSVAYSPDGNWIASGSEDKTIRIWDSNTSLPVSKPLEGHNDIVSSITFAPNGRSIVSGSDDRTLLVWDALTQEVVLGPLEGHTDYVWSVKYSPDGRLIASGSEDGFVRLWNSTSGDCIGTIQRPGKVQEVTFSPCGKHIATACRDNLIRVWDVSSRELCLQPLAGHKSAALAVAYSPDGNILASGSWDWTVRLWDPKTGQLLIDPLRGHKLGITGLCFSPDSSILVSVSFDKSIRAWNSRTGDCIWKRVYGGAIDILSIACGPCQQIAIGGEDPQLSVRDVTTGALTFPNSINRKHPRNGMYVSSLSSLVLSTMPCSCRMHQEPEVKALAWFPDQIRFASAGELGTGKVWNSSTGEDSPDGFFHGMSDIGAIDISPDGSLLVSGSKDKTICLWSTSTHESVLSPIPGHTDKV